MENPLIMNVGNFKKDKGFNFSEVYNIYNGVIP